MIRNVAIVGAGIGAEHLAGYLKLPDRFNVTCICDLDLDRARCIAGPHGIRCEADFAKVLADASIDIVDICLPPHLHLEATLSTLAARKIVICEKPLVTSLADADRLATKISETGGVLYTVFQYRYGVGTTQLRALIDAGLAGKCFAGSLETHWDRDANYYAVDWRGTWAGEQGGALLGHAIHIHDLLMAFLGPVARVYAEVATRVNDIEVEDCAALTIKMASGALISSSVTLGAAGNSSRMRLMFEGFTVESDHAPYAPAAEPWTFEARAPTTQAALNEVLDRCNGGRSGFHGFLTAVSDDLQGQKSWPVKLEDGRASIEFVTAAYMSAKAGAPISLPIDRDAAPYSGWLPETN